MIRPAPASPGEASRSSSENSEPATQNSEEKLFQPSVLSSASWNPLLYLNISVGGDTARLHDDIIVHGFRPVHPGGHLFNGPAEGDGQLFVASLKAVIAQVPFVDIMNTMLDASLPLTTSEYIEWGNPNEKEALGEKAYASLSEVPFAIQESPGR